MNAPARLPLPPALRRYGGGAGVHTAARCAKNVPVAIIGAGFTGLSTALHLPSGGAGDGLESAKSRAGAPRANNRRPDQSRPQQTRPDRERFRPRTRPPHDRVFLRTTNFTLDLIRRYQIPCEARQNGTLRAPIMPPAPRNRGDRKAMHRRGMPVTLLNAAKMREMTGNDRYLCAMLDSRGGDFIR